MPDTTRDMPALPRVNPDAHVSGSVRNLPGGLGQFVPAQRDDAALQSMIADTLRPRYVFEANASEEAARIIALVRLWDAGVDASGLLVTSGPAEPKPTTGQP